MTQSWRANIATSVISLLVAGNLYFVKRLVDQIDKVSADVIEVKTDVAVLKFALTRPPQLQQTEGESQSQGSKTKEGASWVPSAYASPPSR